MLYQAIIRSDGDELVVVGGTESATDVVLRILFGSILSIAGGLVTSVFLLGNGPKPVGGSAALIFGWIIITVFFVALGLGPLLWGLHIWLGGQKYMFRSADKILEAQCVFAGATVWSGQHEFSKFDQVSISPQLFGVFGKRVSYVVSCNGRKSVDLSAFADKADAENFAAQISTQMGLPMVINI